MVLNSSDKLFTELRDMSFPAVGPRLNRDLKRLNNAYESSKASSSCIVDR